MRREGRGLWIKKGEKVERGEKERGRKEPMANGGERGKRKRENEVKKGGKGV